MPLDSFGRHSHGACRAAGARTRVHHATRHCVANQCCKAGLNSEEEVVIPELHEKAHDGTVKEARMDVETVRWCRDRCEAWKAPSGQRSKKSNADTKAMHKL